MSIHDFTFNLQERETAKIEISKISIRIGQGKKDQSDNRKKKTEIRSTENNNKVAIVKVRK